MEYRQKVVSGAELFVTSESFFCLKVSEATKANLVLVAMLCKVRKQSRDLADWSIVSLPVKYICHTLMVFTANYQRMASAAFVIKEGKHIDVHLELILIQMNIVG